MDGLDRYMGKFKNKTAFKKAGGKILNLPILFMDWDALKTGRCPYCGNKLKPIKDGEYYKCQGAKHSQKAFVIGKKKLEVHMAGQEE